MLRLTLLLLSLSAGHARTPERARLADAAAAVRVGDPATALRLLASVPPDADGVVATLRARALLDQGDAAGAAALLAGVTTADLAEPVALLRLRAAHAQGAAPAIIAAAQAVLERPDLAETSRAEARLRLAAARLPTEPAAALRALRALADGEDGPYVRPKALWLLSQHGDAPTRAAAARTLVLELGSTAEGRRARALVPIDSLRPEQRLREARAAFSARAYDLADAAYRVAARVSEAAAQEAAVKRATLRLRLFEGYDEALPLLRSAARGPDAKLRGEALFRLGILYGRQSRFEPAIEAMRRYARKARRGRYLENARYQVARLTHESGRFGLAVQRMGDFLATKPRDPDKYVWFLGWSHYRRGDCPAARRVFARIAGGTNLLVGAKALYWTARCHQIEGDDDALARTLAELFERAPASYYGLLGATLSARAFGTPRQPPWGAPLPLRDPDLLAFERALAETPAGPMIRRVRLLSDAGFPRFAKRAWAPDLLRHAGDRAAEVEAAVLDAIEAFGQRWRRDADRRLPWREDLAGRDDEAHRHAYPAAYLRLARAAGRPHGVSPWWLLAHMMQESRFKERARSHAGALGPMQVLPRTGRRIAARLGFPAGDFLGSQLFEPGVALRHAAWYLAALRAEFDGNMLLAIAAYNGGPRRVADHLARYPDLPFDALIEEIGAHETRNYARKVADHVVRFASLRGTDAERERLLDALTPPPRLPTARGVIRF